MAKGISLHIGINSYNSKSYGKILRPLPNSDRDAVAIKGIATRFRFNSAILLNKDATAANMLEGIETAARYLEYGDMFFISFSGHGSRVNDRNNDEDDGFDETWCLYDRMITDDDLFERWKMFRPGVRILAIADSCHSGSSIKNVEEIEFRPGGRFPVEKTGDIQATCLLMAACQDTQSAFDVPNNPNSLYTGWMLRILSQYDPCESYRELHNRISARMPANSKPNLFRFGPGADQFVKKRPFKI